jgi:hypothetical protein
VITAPRWTSAVTAITGFFETGSAAPRVQGRLVLVLIVAASLAFAIHSRARLEKDEWREAASYVSSLSGCREAPLQVYYWPTEIYAYYLPPPYRQGLRRVSVTPRDPGGDPIAAPGPICPLVLWSGHMIGEVLLEQILDQLQMDRTDVIVWTTRGNMVVLDKKTLPEASDTAGDKLVVDE